MSTPEFLDKPLAEINPLAPEIFECPHAFNARLRSEAPVYHCPVTGIWFVSDYDTVTRVVRDHETFSNRFGQAMGRTTPNPEVQAIQAEGWPGVDTMLTQDPPEQRRYRLLVNQAFTARRVNTMEPEIEALCNQLIDAFVDAGECDLVEAFCVPLPLTVIADQLGVPRSDLELFKKWSDGFVTQLSRQASPEEEVEAARLILEYQKYFAERLEERAAEPRDDIISDIVHARVEGERPLDTSECLSILQQLLVAGNETTTSAIAEGILYLIQNPDQLRAVREDDSLLPNLVEEVLRLSTPTANMWRVTTRDVELGGQQIPAGSMVQVRYSAANRDEGQFAESEAFDVRRDNAKTSLAFGHGIHMCIGASLARKEMLVAFRVLLDRLDNFELAIDPADIVYPPNVLLRGPVSLPIRFSART